MLRVLGKSARDFESVVALLLGASNVYVQMAVSGKKKGTGT